MAILGITHKEDGAALETLPVNIKVAIGEGPEPGNENGQPTPLDHFVFKHRLIRGRDIVWVPAPDVAQVHGERPTEIAIIFLNDDPREIFRTEYALWAAGSCKCRGDLVQIEDGDQTRFEMRAVRKTVKHPEGEPWPGNYRYVEGPKKGQPLEACGEGCPDLARRLCRPSGDLYFMLEKAPTIGTICRLHTSSYRSVRNLSNGLMQIRRLNGGRLTGVKTILKASPERVNYIDGGGTWQTDVRHILSFQLGASDLRTLVASMTEPVRVLGSGSSARGLPRGVQYTARETEEERGAEISGEFYPQSVAPGVEPSETRSGEEDEQLAHICELAHRVGHDDTSTRTLVGQWRHDLIGLERKLRNQIDEGPQIRKPVAEKRKKKRGANRTAHLIAEAAETCRRTAETPAAAPQVPIGTTGALFQ